MMVKFQHRFTPPMPSRAHLPTGDILCMLIISHLPPSRNRLSGLAALNAPKSKRVRSRVLDLRICMLPKALARLDNSARNDLRYYYPSVNWSQKSESIQPKPRIVMREHALTKEYISIRLYRRMTR